MGLLKASIDLLRIPFIFFIFNHAVVLPVLVSDHYFVIALILCIIYVAVLVAHLKNNSVCELFLAAVLMYVTILSYFECYFNREGFVNFYSSVLFKYITGENLSSSGEPNLILIIDFFACTLGAIMLFLQCLELAKHQKLINSLHTESKKDKPTVCFSNTLTEDNDGYFEDIYGELYDYNRWI
ncbi:hypothetical protein CRE_25231 [Caenorhabditis remanei]|uniref:Uncharacterized protein n=1 Tax=Caenorhabditis remanei TaxID=31234 RepID=E3LS23_CAERE|nr:hypothetical protein CRE_25231 [Caenorhabditis remanei]